MGAAQPVSFLELEQAPSQAMGVTVSTSLAKIRENPLLLRFVGGETIPEGDAFWKELLSFAYSPPKNQ